MIDCMKKYKMVLIDHKGEVIYKSDDVNVINAQIYGIGKDGEMHAEINLSAYDLKIEYNDAEKPPEMPTAGVAAKASQIIQEENHKKSIEKEWLRLTDEVCKAVKAGDEKVYSRVIFQENKDRLKEMGYHLVTVDTGMGECRIAWAGIYMDSHRN